MDLTPAQEFAWPEEDLPKRKAERGSSLSAERAVELAKEPMFCFEVRQYLPHKRCNADAAQLHYNHFLAACIKSCFP